MLANFLNTPPSAGSRHQLPGRHRVHRRGAARRRLRTDRLSLVAELTIPTRAGKAVPLTQIATVGYAFDKAWCGAATASRPSPCGGPDLRAGHPGADRHRAARPAVRAIRRLPAGYRLETSGAVEESARGQSSVNAGLPLFIAVVFWC